MESSISICCASCSPLLLRRLDHNESASIKFNDLSNFTKLFRIESRIDYFAYSDVFKQSIQTWISMHPFLSAKIQNFSFYSYFVYDTNIDPLRDVDFYCVEAPSEDSYHDTLRLFLEKETQIKLRHDEKLWRLKLIKLIRSEQCESDSLKYDYDFIFTVHHSITEGRNAYFVLLQLLDIFESLCRNLKKYECVKPLSILPSMEDMFLRSTPNMLSSTSFVSGFRKPSFVNLEKAPEKAYSQDKVLKKLSSNVKIYSLDDKENLISIRELVNTANQNESKFKFIKFEPNELSRLIKKLKEEKVKMQAFLNMLFSFAFQRVYKQRGDPEDRDHSVIYGYAVNLRKFSSNPEMFGENNLNENMGVSTNVFVSHLKEDVDFSQDFSQLFWSCVQNESKEMLNRFQIDEQFKIPNVLGSHGHLKFDLILSNVGIMNESYSQQESLHKVKSCYFTGVNELTNKIAFCYFITVNNQLCWSFLYNSFVIDEPIAEYIVTTVKEIFNKLFQ